MVNPFDKEGREPPRIIPFTTPTRGPFALASKTGAGEALERQRRMSRDTWVQWAQDCIKTNIIFVANKGPYDGETYELGTRIPTNKLYESYVRFCKQRRMYPMSIQEFGMKCSKPEMFGHRVKCEKISNFRGDGRPWGHFIPLGEDWQERLDAQLAGSSRLLAFGIPLLEGSPPDDGAAT